MKKKAALSFEKFGEALPGEDRSYGGNEFYVDMIPSSAFFSNLRAMMPIAQWKELSTYVRSRSQNRCEICGSDVRLEAHERWQFDKQTNLQTLKRIMCLCKQCHLSVHIGLSGQVGLRELTDSHIMSITGWTKEQLAEHIRKARVEWLVLSKIAWMPDVSIVLETGITINSSSSTKENILNKNNQIGGANKKTSLTIDGGTSAELTIDLKTQLRDNWVVIFAETDEEMLGGILLSDTAGLSYVAKPSDSVDPKSGSLKLEKFIEAFNNPTPSKGDAFIAEALRQPNLPQRFILEGAGEISPYLLAKFLAIGKIFSLN